MFSMSLIAVALLTTAGQERPAPAPLTPFPTDDDLTTAFASAHPDAEILSLSPSPTPASDAGVQYRRICGLARVDDRIEPFSVVTTWNDPATSGSVTLVGAPPRPPVVAGWKTRISFATLVDHNGEGEIDRVDRNIAVMARRTALMSCRDLRAPEGVTWVIEPEPHPDPARQARNEALARRMVDAVMGPRRD